MSNSPAGPFGDGAGGTLVVTNVDGLPPVAAPNSFVAGGAPIQIVKTYGILTFTPAATSVGDTTAGTWSYSVRQFETAVEELQAGQSVTEDFTLPTGQFDGATAAFQFTIYGADDLAKITIVDTTTDPLTTYDGTVTEFGNVNNDTTTGDKNAGGTFLPKDIDNPTGPFALSEYTKQSTYGTFTLNGDFTWTYVLANDDPDTQKLKEGEVVTQSMTVQLVGSPLDPVTLAPLVTQTVTVTITGNDDYTQNITNTPAGGTVGSEVTENTDLNAGGNLNIIDVDFWYDGVAPVGGVASPYNFPLTAAGSTFVSSAAGITTTTVQGTYGLFTLVTPNDPSTGAGQTTGNTPFNTASWSYLLGGGTPLVNPETLNASDTETEVMYVSSADGGVVGKGFEVTVKGKNDVPDLLWNKLDNTVHAPPVLTSALPPSSVNVLEAGGVSNASALDIKVTGIVSNEDADDGEDGWSSLNVPQTDTAIGTFKFDYATGAWSYELKPGATDPLVAGQTLSETFKLKTNDFANISQSITVFITGANDTAEIVEDGTQDLKTKEAGGVANGNVEDPFAKGKLLVTDVDGDGALFARENYFQGVAPDLGNTSEDDLRGKYGNFKFNSNTGDWEYKLTNSPLEPDSVSGTSPGVNSGAQSTLLQLLDQGQSDTDTLIVYSADNSASFQITVTVQGSFDAIPVIVDTTILANDREVAAEGLFRNQAGAAHPSAPTPNISASGDLATTNGEGFVATNLVGTYGKFQIDALGTWQYTLDNEDPDTLKLLSAVNSADVPVASQQDFFTVTTTTSVANPVPATYTIPVNVFGAYTQVDLKGLPFDAVTPNVGVNAAAGATPVVKSNGSITYIARNGDLGESLKVYLNNPTTGPVFQWGSVTVVDSTTNLTPSVVTMPTSAASDLGPGVVQGTLHVWDADPLLNALSLNLGVSQGRDNLTTPTPGDVIDMSIASPNGGLASGYGGNDTITGTANVDYIDGGANDDQISAGAGNDTVRGGDGSDSIQGGGDNDVLSGDDGQDTLRGNGGNDTLNGGAGRDTMTGAAGNDTFVFVAPFAPFGSDDTVSDFTTGVDKLWFMESVLTSTAFWTAPGTLPLSDDYGNTTIGVQDGWFQNTTLADANAGDTRFIFNPGTGELFYDADGSGVGLANLVATLTGASLVSTDFVFGQTPPAP